MKTNKEVINSLTEYFSKQDIKIVSRTLAGMIIDFQRILEINRLGVEEKKCLLFRIKKNVESLRKFIKEGPEHNLILINLETANE